MYCFLCFLGKDRSYRTIFGQSVHCTLQQVCLIFFDNTCFEIISPNQLCNRSAGPKVISRTQVRMYRYLNYIGKYRYELCCLFLSFQVDGPIEYDCSSLIRGQFLCTNLDIDEQTQQPRNCNRDTQKSTQWCEAAPGITCL